MSDPTSKRDPTLRPHVSLKSMQDTSFGQGWISGVLSTLLGGLGLGVVLCFHFPEWLTMPQLRSLYPLTVVRALLYVVLVTAFLLASLSVCLRYNKSLGLAGIGLTLLAARLGGSQVPVGGHSDSGPPLGFSLDWFLLNLILYSLVYVPLERRFALHPEQPIFRSEWTTDIAYFFVNTLMIQVISVMTLSPALVLFDWARVPSIVHFVSTLPLVAQLLGVLLVADFAQYWVHRAFHRVPCLWRLHAIHHSTESMDWLAGSRLHLIDAIVTRGATYIPIYVLGFSMRAFYAYLLIVVIQATFIHANVRWEFPRLQWLLATPCFHHWHHSAEVDAVDKNFAVHTPIWDRLFGTYYMPGHWPHTYGLAHGKRIPAGWLRQLFYPFTTPVSACAESEAASNQSQPADLDPQA